MNGDSEYTVIIIIGLYTTKPFEKYFVSQLDLLPGGHSQAIEIFNLH